MSILRQHIRIFLSLIFISLSLANTGLTTGRSNSYSYFYRPLTHTIFEEPYGGMYLQNDRLLFKTPPYKLKISTIKRDFKALDDSKILVFSLTMDGKPIGLATVVSMEDFVILNKRELIASSFKKIVTKKLSYEREEIRSESLELIGADIAGQRVSLRIRGNVDIIGKYSMEDRSEQILIENKYQSNTFQIDQKQSFKIEGKIGDRISILVDQDSERDFEFDNNMEIKYLGNEDDIVQSVDAGNITLSLPGTKLAMFSGQSNGLFGIKSSLKIGALDIITIASLEKGKKARFSLADDEALEQQIPAYTWRRNTYFFINKYYRRKFYPLNESGQHIALDRTVSEIQVYKSVSNTFSGNNDADVYTGDYYDYPQDGTAVRVGSQLFTQLIKEKDYFVDNNFGFIKLATPAQESEVIAIAYRDSAIRDNGLLVWEYGDLPSSFFSEGDTRALGIPVPGDTLRLKVIKEENSKPTSKSWDLEWKNVYYLGATDIDPTDFSLKLKYTEGTIDSEESTDGVNFLTMYGLDRKNESGENTPDGILDVDNTSLLDLKSGELFFPYLQPFKPYIVVADSGANLVEDALNGSVGNGGNPELVDQEDYQCFSFYDNTSNLNSFKDDDKFSVFVSYSNKSSIINLGFNLIENSEVVTLNSVRLTKGLDYKIDYFTGRLELLTTAALAPGANLDVTYEKNEFFNLDKKVILGSRAEYKFGEDKTSYIGLTALYFSQSSIDDKVRIGKEPFNNFVWDANGKLDFKLPWLTRTIDWLPLLRTNAESSFKINGEIAQVIPNPNTRNNDALGEKSVAYLDDFESSRRESKLSILANGWYTASIPEVALDNLNNINRSFVEWHNPINRLLTTQIWPNKETSAQAQNDVTDILMLSVLPDSSFAVRNNNTAPQESWGGIMTALSSGYSNQMEAKFLELWINGGEGQLHIDLGLISEDLQDVGEKWIVNINDKTINKGHGYLDTEDLPELAFPTGSGYVDDGEDVGLDGLPYNSPEHHNQHPSWEYYDFDPTKSPVDYRHINGTEGNLNSEGGRYPDTEDINGDGSLSEINAYFTKTISLQDAGAYLAGETQFDDGTPTGWKLIRIPLREFDVQGDERLTTWEEIKYVRLWMDGLPLGGDTLAIAAIDIVGNEWQEDGIIALDDREEIPIPDSTYAGYFNISIINTEDNPDRYNPDRTDPSGYHAPPEGVLGALDALTQLRSKEQSLVLQVDDLASNHKVMARKYIFDQAGLDLIHYKYIKMFVHGWDKTHGGVYESNFTDYIDPMSDESDLEVFLRMGHSDLDYYEIRMPVYGGWDERNEINFAISDLANFKLSLDDSSFQDTLYPGTDSASISTFSWNDLAPIDKFSMRKEDGRTLVVSGGPSFSKIKRIRVGLINHSNHDMTGEVWLDELRLTNIEQNTATAFQTNMTLTLADFGAVTLDIQKGSADFHNAQKQFGSGANLLSKTVASSWHAEKLLPQSWGMNIPVNITYKVTDKDPKYITGSDIEIGSLAEGLRDTVKSLVDHSESFSWNFSLGKKEASKHWLSRYTIDKIALKVGQSRSNSNNATTAEKRGQKTDGSISYSIDFGKDNTIAPLAFAKKIPFIGEALEAFEFSYLPTKISMNSSVVEDSSYSRSRNTNSDAISKHTLSMNRNLNMDWPITPTVTASYKTQMANNLDRVKNNKLKILQEGDFGHKGNLAESMSLTWNPKVTLLSPRLSYSSTFNATDKIAESDAGIDLKSSNRIGASISIEPKKLFELVYTPEEDKSNGNKASGGKKTPETNTNRGGKRGKMPPPKEEENTVEKKDVENERPKNSLSLLKGFHGLLDHFSAISITSNQTNSRSDGRLLLSIDTVYDAASDSAWLEFKEMAFNDIDYAYRFGLVQNPDFLYYPLGNLVATNTSIDLNITGNISITSDLTANYAFNVGDKKSLTSPEQGEVVNRIQHYFPSGKLFGIPDNSLASYGNEGFPFPSIHIRYMGLSKIEWVKNYLNQATIESDFKSTYAVRTVKGEMESEDISIMLSPLLRISIQTKQGIGISFNWNLEHGIKNSQSGSSNHNEKNSINASANYQHSGGLKIPIPMREPIYFENTINFKFDATFSNSVQYKGNIDGGSLSFGEGEFNKSFQLKPTIDYTFSKKVNGWFSYMYRETETRGQGKKTYNDFEFGVRIAIRG